MKPAPRPGTGLSEHTSSGFDRVARLYRWAEYLLLGPLLTQTRQHLLPHAVHARHALVLGDGDGRFLAKLLRKNPELHAIALDNSERMLHLLQTRCAFAAGRVHIQCASANHLPQELDLSSVDLIVTHFFLDCLTQQQLTTLADHLSRRVAPGCRWLLSDFAIPSRQPWHLIGRAYVRSLYLAFRLLTGLQVQQLPDPAKALSAAGFRRIHHHERVKGLLYSELWQLSA